MITMSHDDDRNSANVDLPLFQEEHSCLPWLSFPTENQENTMYGEQQLTFTKLMLR